MTNYPEVWELKTIIVVMVMWVSRAQKDWLFSLLFHHRGQSWEAHDFWGSDSMYALDILEVPSL